MASRRLLSRLLRLAMPVRLFKLGQVIAQLFDLAGGNLQTGFQLAVDLLHALGLVHDLGHALDLTAKAGQNRAVALGAVAGDIDAIHHFGDGALDALAGVAQVGLLDQATEILVEDLVHRQDGQLVLADQAVEGLRQLGHLAGLMHEADSEAGRGRRDLQLRQKIHRRAGAAQDRREVFFFSSRLRQRGDLR